MYISKGTYWYSFVVDLDMTDFHIIYIDIQPQDQIEEGEDGFKQYDGKKYIFTYTAIKCLEKATSVAYIFPKILVLFFLSSSCFWMF